MRARGFVVAVIGSALSLIFTGVAAAVSTVSAAAGLAAAAGEAGPRPVALESADVEAFMDGLMASRMKEKHLVGAAVVIVRDGKVILSKGYGYADLKTRAPVDPGRTLFRVGSISKLFVWTAVMQLVEAGRLSLDADVRAYLDFDLPSPYGEPVTLRTLMSHTGGFEDRSRGLFALEASPVPSLRSYLSDHPPALVYPPGKVGAYSNYGAALAGYIVERASGLPFWDYAEKYIFSPLGMETATFLQPLTVGRAGELASAYGYVDGAHVKGPFEYVVPYPAGSASASALDIVAFMIAHLEGGRYGDDRILKPETVARMHRRSYSADARIAGMAHGFFERIDGGSRMIFHCGDTFLFHAGLFLFPQERSGLFIAMNAAGGADLAEATASAFAARYFPAAETGDPAVAEDFSVRAPLYAGQYYPSRANFTSFEKVFALLSPVNVSVTEDDEVVISASGSMRRYRETEAGLLVCVDDQADRIALEEEGGHVYLHTSGASVYRKAPWYGGVACHLLVVGGGALLFLFAAIRWGISFIADEAGRRIRASSILLFRAIGGFFGLAYLAFLLSFMDMLGDMHPVLGEPNLLFAMPASSFATLTALPAALWFSGLALWPAAVIAWVRGHGTLADRLLNTGIAACAFLILWSLAYWNVLP